MPRGLVIALLLALCVALAVSALRRSADPAARATGAVEPALAPQNPLADAAEGDTGDISVTSREAVGTAKTQKTRVTGRVVRAGAPLGSGIRVRLRRHGSVYGTGYTDHAGRFAVESSQAGSMQLDVTGVAATVVAEARDIEVRAAQTDDLGDVELARGHSAHGTIVDHETRGGIPGARVFFGGDTLGLFAFALRKPADEADPYVTTDGSGRFTIPHVASGCMLCMRVEHDVYQPLRFERRVTHDDVSLGELAMRRGMPLVGRVVANTAGVGGARVYPSRDPRKSTVTDAYGEFRLDGIGFGDLWITSAGFVSRLVNWNRDTPTPLLIELSALGSIDVVIEDHGGGHRALDVKGPEYAYRFEPAGDDRMSASSLEPGVYRIRAWSHPLGMSEIATVDLEPGGHREVHLSITPHPAVPVDVVDEQGHALAGAVIRCEMSCVDLQNDFVLRDEGPPQEVVTDAHGRATLSLPTFADLQITTTLDGYDDLHASVGDRERADGGPVRLVMCAARPTGTLIARVDREPAGVRTDVMIRGPGEQRFHKLPRAEDGLVQTELAAGDYEARLAYDLPLHSRPSIDIRTKTALTVRPGETTDIELRTSPLGHLRVRVIAGGHPVAGARVEIASLGAHGRPLTKPWAPPRTDALGNCEIRTLRPGRFRLQARRDERGLPSRAVDVHLRSIADNADVVLELGSASVRGRFDLSWIDGRLAKLIVTDRDSFLAAYLFRAHEAGSDPFFAGYHGLPETSDMHSATPDLRGAFRFDDVPPGVWVLRIVTMLDEIQHQRVLRVPDSGHLDLGSIARDRLVETATARCLDRAGVPHAHLGAWVRRADPAVGGRGVFATTAEVLDGVLTVRGVPAGRYELEFFEPHVGGFLRGIDGPSLDEFRTIEIDANGHMAPAEIQV